jgi:hypothetical protein
MPHPSKQEDLIELSKHQKPNSKENQLISKGQTGFWARWPDSENFRRFGIFQKLRKLTFSAVNFWRKRVGRHSGRFFSQTHLVSLLMMCLACDVSWFISGPLQILCHNWIPDDGGFGQKSGDFSLQNMGSLVRFENKNIFSSIEKML